MKIAVISPSSQSLQEIGTALERCNPSRFIARHEGGISKLRTIAEKEHPDVIIVEGLCHDAGELSPIESVTTSYPQMIIIILCSQQTPEFLINAMRVGVREVLPSPASKDALEAAVSRAESKLGLRNAQRSGRILAFVSCKGGSGSTFLATNLGHQLGAEGKKVLLMDLNLQFGEAVLTVHDRKATSNVAEVARNLSRLDASFLTASTVAVTPNFAILASPDDPAESLQVKPEHLDAILNLAINHYDFIVLDVGKNLDDLTIKALDRAHNIFLVVQTMLPYIRNASRMMTVFRSLGYQQDKVELLVNRFWKNGEIGLEDLRASLGITKMRTIPNGYKEVAKAINEGVPLAVVAVEQPQPQPAISPAVEAYVKLKNKLHLQILEKVDLASLESMSELQLRQEIATLVELLLIESPAQINDIERRMLVRDIQNEMLGLGPLELLMADPSVSDILVNSYNQIYVERRGRLELTNVTFTDDKHLLRIIDKIVSRVGRRIDESSPMVDARLPDGSRVNAIIPPIALDGAMVSIRRFAITPLKMADLVNGYKSLTPAMAVMLEGLAKSKINMLIS